MMIDFDLFGEGVHQLFYPTLLYLHLTKIHLPDNHEQKYLYTLISHKIKAATDKKDNTAHLSTIPPSVKKTLGLGTTHLNAAADQACPPMAVALSQQNSALQDYNKVPMVGLCNKSNSNSI